MFATPFLSPNILFFLSNQHQCGNHVPRLQQLAVDNNAHPSSMLTFLHQISGCLIMLIL